MAAGGHARPVLSVFRVRASGPLTPVLQGPESVSASVSWEWSVAGVDRTADSLPRTTLMFIFTIVKMFS